MSRPAPACFPVISPVVEPAPRPFWSVMIPTYQCAGYLAETLASVLRQNISPELMQIEVVDDFSSDNPEEVVQRLGQGRVSFFRQERNVGMVENFNTCIRRARGFWVHLLHGDDLVLPSFYNAFESACSAQNDIGMIFCRQQFVDAQTQPIELSPLESTSEGVLENFAQKLAMEQCIQCASVIVRREVYESIGGFRPALRFTADWDMWKRLAAVRPVWYLPQALACYRRHSASDSSRLYRTGENVRQIYLSIAYSHYEAPEIFNSKITFAAYRIAARHAIYQAKTYIGARKLNEAFIQYLLAWNRSAVVNFPRLAIVGLRLIAAQFRQWIETRATSFRSFCFRLTRISST